MKYTIYKIYYGIYKAQSSLSGRVILIVLSIARYATFVTSDRVSKGGKFPAKSLLKFELVMDT